jgi:hypothetical protein
MDLHVYRTSQDRWHDLRATARERGAVLAVNALTVDELVQRLTPDVSVATPGQRLALVETSAQMDHGPFASSSAASRYLYDAIAELKRTCVRPDDLRAADAVFLAEILEQYDRKLRAAGLCDPQDRYLLAASRVEDASAIAWLSRFQRVVLHALYDLTEAEFILVRSVIEALPEGGAVVLFNSTANVKPTQFAEWTWQRFIQDESLAEKTFPEFCRPSHPERGILEKLFVFEHHEPFPADDSLRIVEAPTRYKEVEKIGGDIADLLASGESPGDVVVVVRHIENYGEMLEDVFTQYDIPHRFETGVPLLRVPFIKYWLALLDLVSSERSREALARVMSSAYFCPRLSPDVDVERALARFGYLDRHHLPASVLAARKNSPLAPEIERFEKFLDALEQSEDTVTGFLDRVQPSGPLNERDRQAWRVLAEELSAVGAIFSQMGHGPWSMGHGPFEKRPSLQFAQFRKLASDIAGLRTVDRLAASMTAPGLARVRIIHPHSLGTREHKWIFAPGFTEGEFPARSFSNPWLSDGLIEKINTRIRPRRLMTQRDRNRREPLYLFMILDSATRRVTLTYPGSTLEGDPIQPSVYIGEIVRHYAESPVVQAVTGPPHAEREWRSRVAEEWRRGSLPENRLRVLLGDDIVERAKFESKGIMRGRVGRAVLPLDGVWHPSELNSLSSCPFVFFARHRLRIRAADTPEFEVPAQEIGILAHTILRDFYSQRVPRSANEARLRMNEIITRRLSAADVNGEGPYSVFDPSLWKIRRPQLVSALNRYVDFAVRDALDGFETQVEYLDAPLSPSALGQTLLAGKPDHVAVRRDGARVDAIRIDDFKYSAASGATARLLKQSFQLPVYAYLAARALAAEDGVQIEGRYLLLRSPGNPVISHAIDDGVFRDVRDRIERLLERVRDGRLEPDPADTQVCVDCDYRRLCRLYGL